MVYDDDMIALAASMLVLIHKTNDQQLAINGLYRMIEAQSEVIKNMASLIMGHEIILGHNQ